jgi:hypothetical protein
MYEYIEMDKKLKAFTSLRNAPVIYNTLTTADYLL